MVAIRLRVGCGSKLAPPKILLHSYGHKNVILSIPAAQTPAGCAIARRRSGWTRRNPQSGLPLTIPRRRIGPRNRLSRETKCPVSFLVRGTTVMNSHSGYPGEQPNWHPRQSKRKNPVERFDRVSSASGCSADQMTIVPPCCVLACCVVPAFTRLRGLSSVDFGASGKCFSARSTALLRSSTWSRTSRQNFTAF